MSRTLGYSAESHSAKMPRHKSPSPSKKSTAQQNMDVEEHTIHCVGCGTVCGSFDLFDHVIACEFYVAIDRRQPWVRSAASQAKAPIAVNTPDAFLEVSRRTKVNRIVLKCTTSSNTAPSFATATKAIKQRLFTDKDGTLSPALGSVENGYIKGPVTTVYVRPSKPEQEHALVSTVKTALTTYGKQHTDLAIALEAEPKRQAKTTTHSLDIILKNVRCSLADDDISEGLLQAAPGGFSCLERFTKHNKDALVPMPVVKVTLKEEKDYLKLLNAKRILFNSESWAVEAKHAPKQVRRCFKCLAYDHLAEACTKNETCIHCGKDRHTAKGERCAAPKPHCANCGGDHSASYKGCPAYKQAVEKGITATRPRISGVSYSHVAGLNNATDSTPTQIQANLSAEFSALKAEVMTIKNLLTALASNKSRGHV